LLSGSYSCPFRLAPRELLFDHLRQVIVTIVVLEDLDQLGV